MFRPARAFSKTERRRVITFARQATGEGEVFVFPAQASLFQNTTKDPILAKTGDFFLGWAADRKATVRDLCPARCKLDYTTYVRKIYAIMLDRAHSNDTNGDFASAGRCRSARFSGRGSGRISRFEVRGSNFEVRGSGVELRGSRFEGVYPASVSSFPDPLPFFLARA